VVDSTEQGAHKCSHATQPAIVQLLSFFFTTKTKTKPLQRVTGSKYCHPHAAVARALLGSLPKNKCTSHSCGHNHIWFKEKVRAKGKKKKKKEETKEEKKRGKTEKTLCTEPLCLPTLL
jgi:hypothetical protein